MLLKNILMFKFNMEAVGKEMIFIDKDSFKQNSFNFANYKIMVGKGFYTSFQIWNEQLFLLIDTVSKVR